MLRNLKIYILAILLLISLGCKKKNIGTINLSNHLDTISYCLGLHIADNMKQYKIDKINPQVLSFAISQAMNNVPADSLLIDPSVAKNILKIYFYKEKGLQIQTNIKDWQTFLVQNSARSGVHTLSSGVQYEIVKQGHGPKPRLFDIVTVKYVGYLPNGKVFDRRFSQNPVSFKLIRAIPGWQKALTHMPQGSIWKIYIPPYLAFGNSRNGIVPPNSVVIYKIHLLKIKRLKTY